MLLAGNQINICLVGQESYETADNRIEFSLKMKIDTNRMKMEAQDIASRYSSVHDSLES